MRILVAIVHYFSPEADPRHSSTDAARRDGRTRAVAGVVEAYRGLFGPPATLDIAGKRFVHGTGTGDQVDIALVTVPGASLLPDTFCARHAVTRLDHRPDNPRMLGFHAHELFASLRHQYDMFVFTEDDLRPSDPDLFAKLAWFNARHGDRRLLLPNRFEWNPAGPAIKTYIDGDLRAGLVDPMIGAVPDDDMIADDVLGRTRLFRRARNPHSGFFAITQGQLGRWMRQPHWLDRDCSFISPLESAATLGISRTFAVFKPFAASAGFLELQHLDARFSSIRLPRDGGGLAALAAAPDPA